MCLGVPMEVVEVNATGQAGVVELEGTRYQVNLSLIEEARLGDYVIVHAGYAIERLDQQEADARLGLFEQMARQREEEG